MDFVRLIRKNLLLIGLLTIVNQVLSQVPYINNVDISSGTFGETAIISGFNFGNNAGDLIVKFGSADATIVSASDGLLEVLVPAGATADNLTVTNTNGSAVQTGYSNGLFNLSFGGSTGISAAAFDDQVLVNEVTTDIRT